MFGVPVMFGIPVMGSVGALTAVVFGAESVTAGAVGVVGPDGGGGGTPVIVGTHPAGRNPRMPK